MIDYRMTRWRGRLVIATAFLCLVVSCEHTANADEPSHPQAVRADDDRILISTQCLKAEVWPKGYVSGIKAGTFFDRKTGAHDSSFGLDIVDFLMGPGADGGLPYQFGNKVHGHIAKHYIELPQVCTQAKSIDSRIIRGTDFVAIHQSWKWTEAAPGYKPGSTWEQTIVFPSDRRYVFSSDCVRSVNRVDNLFLRTDLPCHVKHDKGSTFEEIYLSYEGRLGADKFGEDFAPDERYLYQRKDGAIPDRMIRAHKIRGEKMPWLAGMTLDSGIVSEAWCHQRGYVCFIQEIGGLPVQSGGGFAAAYILGYFDSIDQMQREYDRYRGYTSIAATERYWLLSEGVIRSVGGDRFRILPQGDWPKPEHWRVRVHGKGNATINGQPVEIDGERVVRIPH